MVVYRHPTGFFSQSRCTIENWHSRSIDPSKDINPHTGKNGIIERKENGNITIKFQSPASLWLNSRNSSVKSDPTGGTVILLGHNKDFKLETAFDGSHQTMKIASGLHFWCDTPLGVRKVDVISIQPAGENRIHLLAGVHLSILGLKTKVRKFAADRMVIVWSEATYLNSDTDNKAYLKQKADLV